MLTNLSIIIGTILSLGAVFQLVTNMLLATPVEYHLESNYQRIFRYTVHIIIISFFIVLFIFQAYLNSSEGSQIKDFKINNPYFIGVYILFLLIFLVSCIYIALRDIWTENYQRKLVFKKKNGEEYVILKKFLNNKVLLTPVKSTKKIQYCIVKEDDLEQGLLELESYKTVSDRRAIKYFTRWDNVHLVVKIVIILFLIIIGILLMSLLHQSGIEIIWSLIGAIAILIICLIPYLWEYKKGKKLIKSE